MYFFFILLGLKKGDIVEKVSRNDPCPCGSGKKFKKCCESQKKVRTFQVLSSESKVQGISSFLYAKTLPEKKNIEESEKK